jgi:hypothetical protein
MLPEPTIHRWLEDVSASPSTKGVLNCRIVMAVLKHHRSEVLE